jgi:hypothetical protein
MGVKFLHITDTHLKKVGSPFNRDDFKVHPPGIEPATREDAIADTLLRVASELGSGQCLDGVIFCGDAQSGGQPGGHQLLFDLILDIFKPFGIVAGKIVAVPGNHDVPMGSDPSSLGRYAAFTEVWRKNGCITPWLDGIDAPNANWQQHVLLDDQHQWAVVAINSCNWSHVDARPPEMRKIWDAIPKQFGSGDSLLEAKLRGELATIARYDMARVSPEQLQAIGAMLGKMPRAANMSQLRIAALHHHLRAPSHREEFKPFADITNLEQVRTFLQEKDFAVLLHGHKHETKVQYDHVDMGHGIVPHRVLMIAGATFDAGREGDAMRIVEIDGIPSTPAVSIRTFPVPRRGLNTTTDVSPKYRLWSPLDLVDAPPIVIQGKDFDEVYARVRVAADEEAKNKTLIVHLDLADTAAIRRLPKGYPAILQSEKDMADWLNDLVSWWQLPSSQLDQRIHYIHGNRLRRFGSNVDQIARIGKLLEGGPTTRAIAVLIDPSRDFRKDLDERAFASFCLVQFIRRDVGGATFVDCVAFYRAQEMVRWWPINVAELLHLQGEVCLYVNGEPGRITTITADARSTAQSPTRVAMPVVDRWLDQAPEKLYVLAGSLARGALESELENAVANQWRDALKDLRLAAEDRGADGGPVVAIEGLRTLARYLEASHGMRAAQCASLASKLMDVANLGGDNRRNDPRERDDWIRRIVAALDSVERTCAELWNSSSSKA